MRTTLDIENDVLIMVKERARRERKSAGAVITSIVRGALNGSAVSKANDFVEKDGLMFLAPRGEVITLEHVQRLLEEED